MYLGFEDPFSGCGAELCRRIGGSRDTEWDRGREAEPERDLVAPAISQGNFPREVTIRGPPMVTSASWEKSAFTESAVSIPGRRCEGAAAEVE